MRREFRILKHEEFLDIQRKGRRAKAGAIVLFWRENQAGKSRIGIQVTKRCGNAVRRNRIKRQIRSILASSHDFRKPFDIIIAARPEFDTSSFQKEKESLLALLAELEKTSEEKH